MGRRGLGALLAVVSMAVSGAADAQVTASNFTSGVRYDAGRRVVGTISADPDGTWNGGMPFQAVRNTYDAAGRLTKVEKGSLAAWQSEQVAPASWSGFSVYTIVETTWDAMSRKTSEAVRAGPSSPGAGTIHSFTQYSYDASGRLECTAVRMNPATFGSLATGACSQTGGGGFGEDRITRNVYDAAGQLLKVQKGYGTSLQQDYATYEYTPNGKQKAVIDANGNRAELTWDGFDRQSGWYFPSKTSPGVASTSDYEAYGYDANGNRTSLRKRDGRTIAFAYDALNRVTSKTYPQGGARGVYYDYDLRGLQTAARFDSPSGSDAVLSGWDGFGQQVSSTTAMGGTSRTLTYQYNADGGRTRVTWPDATYVNYERFDTGEPFYTVVNNALPLFHTPLEGGGRLTAVYRWGVSANTWSISTGLGYDGISRVNALNHSFANGAYNDQVTLSYNPAGQIVSRSRSNDTYGFTNYLNVNRAYARNGLNQYTSAGPANFTYDDNGNLTGDGTTSYAYDIENRLTSASNGAQMTWDPTGRLWQTSGTGNGTTQFLYDGDALVAEYDAWGGMLKRYVHSDGDDDPLVEFTGGGVSAPSYLFADHQGSIVAVTDANGNAVQVNRYDEYGIPGSGNAGRFQYTGQAYLPDLGMYHYKARIYSPTLGRFLQTDPIGYDDQINLYAYVANDPVNGRDPTGQYECAKGNDCTKFESYRQALIAARDSYKPNSADYRAIDGSLQKIGDPGVKGIAIAEGGVNKANPAVSATMDGTTYTMTVYTPTLEKLAQMGANDATKFGATIIGHEANPDHMRSMTSRADRLSNEVGGYTTQEAASRALGVSDSTQSSVYGSDRATRIQNNAVNSVNAACKGSQHPTCM